jgi:translocation and assembly module TamB
MNSEANTPPDSAAQQRAKFGRRHLVIGLVLALLIWLAVLAAAGLTLWWGVRTETGAAWLLRHAPGVQVDQPQGALLGDFSARRLSLSVPGAAEPLVLSGLRWQGLSLQRSPHPGQWLKLHIAALQADRVDLSVPASQDASSGAPTSLALPLEIELPSVKVGEFHTAALGGKPLRGLDASLHLGAQAGAQHLLSLRSLQWDQLRASGQAQLATRGDLRLAAQAQLQPLPGASDTQWRAQLQVNGPLARPDLQAQLDALQQSLKAQASLRPFEPWPLASLQASTTRLNLAALNSSWPQTALSGDAQISSQGWDRPAQLRLQLRNPAAGRWDQQRLPLRSATLDLQATPSDAHRIELRAFDLQLGSDAAPAGRLQGEGGGQLDAWTLATRISDLQTALLDQRIAPLRLNGKLQLKGSGGLEQPKVDAQGQLQGQLQLAALASPATAPPARATKGNARARPAPARAAPISTDIKLDASLSPQLIELREVRLSSGAASASGQAKLTRQTGSGWRVQGSAQLKDFDPRLLWAGPADSGWQRGPHRLNAQLEADLLTGAPGWPKGQASVKLADSQLLGLPLNGQAQLRNEGGKPAQLSARLQSDVNQLSLDAQLPAGAAERWTARLQAPELARLAPLLALLPFTRLAHAGRQARR